MSTAKEKLERGLQNIDIFIRDKARPRDVKAMRQNHTHRPSQELVEALDNVYINDGSDSLDPDASSLHHDPLKCQV